MRNEFLCRHYSGPSSICKELVESTKLRKVHWISFNSFTDYLDLEGIAIDDIQWFYCYLNHIRGVQHYPLFSETYFTYYDDRVFAISQSKYSREIRIDFTSNFRDWRRIIESQSSLQRLHNYIEFTCYEDSNEECRELLYSTGCIHA